MFPKLSLVLIFSFLNTGCNQLGLSSIPKAESNKKWANPNNGSKFLELNGMKIHYRDQGPKDGKVILAIHGIADSLHVFDDMTKILSKEYRVIRFDLPGFGLSDAEPTRNYSPKNFIHIIESFIQKMNLSNLNILGNSLGGFMAWNYAISYPEKVNSIFLLDPAGFPMKAPWVVQLANYGAIRRLTTISTPRILVAKAIHEVYGDKSKVTQKKIDRYYELMLREGNRKSYMDIFKMILSLQESYPVNLKLLKVKTMVTWGELDQWISPKQIDLWQKEVPFIQTKVYPGVGHTPQQEIPTIVSKDYIQFIEN